MGISYGEPIYVIKIDRNKYSVYWPESALFKTKFIIKEVNWLREYNTNDIDIVAKVRSTTSGIKAKIDFITDDKIEVTTLGKKKQLPRVRHACYMIITGF